MGPQVVEAALVVRAVGDVGVIRGITLAVVETVTNDTDAQAEKLVETAHPLGITAGEVIVYRHDMDAFALEGVEIGGKSGDQRFPLAGLDHANLNFSQHGTVDNSQGLGHKA